MSEATKGHAVHAHEEREQRGAAIGRQVLLAIGQPRESFRLQVCQLWDNRYRVNVLSSQDGLGLRIANSYFLVTDGAGTIVEASPALTRAY